MKQEWQNSYLKGLEVWSGNVASVGTEWAAKDLCNIFKVYLKSKLSNIYICTYIYLYLYKTESVHCAAEIKYNIVNQLYIN